jgi:hypothetical protein
MREGEPHLNAEIIEREKVEKIESAPIRVDDKVTLLLLIAGVKPAGETEIMGERWEKGEKPKHVDKSYIKDIECFLQDLDLPFKIAEPETKADDDTKFESINIFAGKDEESLDNLSSAKTPEEFGKAYGYPESTIDAYKNQENSMMAWELPDEIRNSDFYPFIMYRLSTDNWHQEIETAKLWAETVKANSPEIFEEYSEFIRSAHLANERDLIQQKAEK